MSDREPIFSRLFETLALTLLLLALAVTGALAALFAVAVVDPTSLAPRVGPFAELVTRLGEEASLRPVPVGIAGLVVGVGSLTALVARLGSAGDGRRRADHHLLDADDRGFVVVDSRGVSIVAARAACRAEGVVDCLVDVRPEKGSAVSLRTEVLVHPGAPVKTISTRVRDAVHEAVERMIGLDVASVGVRVQVLEPDELARTVW